MSSNAAKVELRLRVLILSVNLLATGDCKNLLLSYYPWTNLANLFSASAEPVQPLFFHVLGTTTVELSAVIEQCVSQLPFSSLRRP